MFTTTPAIEAHRGTTDYFQRGKRYLFGTFDRALSNGEGEHVVFRTREQAEAYEADAATDCTGVYSR